MTSTTNRDPELAAWGRALAEARRANRLADLPLHTLPGRREAEQVQAEAVAVMEGQRVGYKIGATSDELQRLLACNQPIYAPVFAEDVIESGADYPLPAGFLGIECEFAFEMAQPCPGPGEAVTRESLSAAVARCRAAVEIVGRRVPAHVPLTEASGIADFAFHIALVLGPEIPDWRNADLAAYPVSACVEGAEAARGTGALVLGHPLQALAWLAETLQRTGGWLEAGAIVSTGTCTGIVRPEVGQTVEARFGDLPPVRVRFV